MKKYRIVISMGDPAGVGPEIIVKAACIEKIRCIADWIIVGDKKILELAAKRCRLNLSQDIKIFDLKNININTYKRGVESSEYGKASIDYIQESVKIIKQKKADALVTAPVNKHSINKAGFPYFSGHTEYLAHLTSTKQVWMMLVGGPLRVVLVTTHCALRDVPDNLSRKKIKDAILATDKALKQFFGIAFPCIGVCGLNPHTSDKGIFGDEEKRLIIPVVKELKKSIKNLQGPVSADALFYKAYKHKLDAIVAMYHDQGLVALKMIAFETGVNITLGLPFIRTSPDHGTAMDIAEKSIASPSSFICAMKIAVDMIKRKNA